MGFCNHKDVVSSYVHKLPQERHWSFPGMAAALQALMGSSPSQRLQHALALTPSLLRVYFSVALRDVNDCKYPFTHDYLTNGTVCLILRFALCWGAACITCMSLLTIMLLFETWALQHC